MALKQTPDGGTARIGIGSASNLDNINAGTIWAWIWVDYNDPANPKGILTKGTLADGMVFVLTGTQLYIQRGRATDLNAKADLANFAAYGEGKWIFVACAWDTGGSAGDQILLVGDLNTMAAEPSAYATQTAGSGATGSNASNNAQWGNLNPLGDAFEGRLEVGGVLNVKLTADQIRALQFASLAECNIPGTVGLYWFNDTTTVPDLSGNANTGTPAGTTITVESGPVRRRRGAVTGWRGSAGGGAPAGVTGTAAITLGAATLVAAGTVAVDGDLALTLGGVGLTAAGTVPVDGDLVVTLGSLGLAAAGTVALVGAAGVTLEALTLTAAGVVGGAVTGTLTATLGGVGLAAAGTVAVDGDLAVTLGALTLSATGGAPGADGSALITLAGVGLTAVGVVVVGGAQATTLGAATLTAAGAVAIRGSVAITLGALTLTALDDGGTIRAGRKTVVTVGDTRTRAAVGETRTRATVTL